VFENKVLMIFGLKRDEFTGKWRKLHKKLDDQYSPPTIIRVIKSSRMRWRACNAYGDGKGVYKVLVGKHEGKNHWGDPGVDGKIILRWIFRNLGGGLDWVELTQDRDRRRAFVTPVMNLRVP
jgi:hypothetical protein